jgi:SAM-dependent methyltransferase
MRIREHRILERPSVDDVLSRYTGRTALRYERVRHGRKWDAEHEAIQQLLLYVREGTKTLDIPVGTGRLLAFFAARKFDTYGIDASPDMIRFARARADESTSPVRLEQGNILSIPYQDGYFGLVVCIRFLNLVNGEVAGLALHELARVSSDRLLIGIRYVAPLGELRSRDVMRLISRPLWLFRRLLRGSDVLVQKKAFVMQLLDGLSLGIEQIRFVERRWDGSDYVVLLLKKQTDDR